MRAGGEYFLEPAEAVQRRYEALRCYFVEDASAESVGARFGYSPATVHQLAAELRAGRSSFFRSSKPGPKGSRKTHTIRDRVLVLRAADRSVTEIAQALTAQGDAVSAQTVWAILKSEGLERLERRGPAGSAPRLEPVTAKALGAWPTGARYDCDHAGLYLLLPAMVELGLDQLIGAANYPGTKVLSSFHSMASLLMLKCSRRGRAGNAFPLGADPGLGLALGLLALPKATHLTSYSYRVRRASNLALLEGLGRQCRQVGLYNGQGGFNLDFHTIRHHGEQVPLEEHYVVSRSNGPARCSPSSPRTTPPPRWSTPTPISPKPNKPAKSSPSPSTGSASPAPIPGCWSSTPNSPPTPCSTSSPPAASPSSPCANAAPKSSKPWPRYPPQPGGPTTSNAPAVTGTPRSTRRSCTSKASKRRYVR